MVGIRARKGQAERYSPKRQEMISVAAMGDEHSKTENSPRTLPKERGLATEIAIIVVAVLLALLAQEAANWLTWCQRTAAAEQSMAIEIKNSLLANQELQKTKGCVDRQLTTLERAIVAGDRKRAAELTKGQGVFGIGRLWADDAFNAAVFAQVSDHLGAEKLKGYAQVYAMIRKARHAQDAIEASRPELMMLEMGRSLPATTDGTRAQLRAVAQIRAGYDQLRSLGELIAAFAKADLGLENSDREYGQARLRLEILRACEADADAAELVASERV